MLYPTKNAPDSEESPSFLEHKLGKILLFFMQFFIQFGAKHGQTEMHGHGVVYFY